MTVHRPAKVASLLLLGLLACGCKSTQGAEESDKTVRKANLEIGSQLVSGGQFRAALEYLMPFEKKDPDNANVRMLIGYALLGTGDIHAAESEFRRVTAIDSRNDEARLNLGYMLILEKRLPEARRTLQKIVDRGEFLDMEKVYNNIGLSYLTEKKCDDARKYFSKAIDQNPTFVAAFYNTGKCFMQERKFSAAIPQFSKAVDFCPGCVEPVLDLSQAYYLAGRKDVAIDKLQRLLTTKLDADSERRARKALMGYRSR